MCLRLYEIEPLEKLIKVSTGNFKGFYVNENMHDIVMRHCEMFLYCEPFMGPWNNVDNDPFPHPFIEFVGEEDDLTFIIVFSKTDRPGYLKLLTVCEFDHTFSQMKALNYVDENLGDFEEDPDNTYIRSSTDKDERQSNDKKWVDFFNEIFCSITSREKLFLEPIIDYFND